MKAPTIAIAALVALSLSACADEEPTPAATTGHSMPPATSAAPVTPELARQLADARTATAKYVTARRPGRKVDRRSTSGTRS
jgi:hypothetical protein